MILTILLLTSCASWHGDGPQEDEIVDPHLRIKDETGQVKQGTRYMMGWIVYRYPWVIREGYLKTITVIKNPVEPDDYGVHSARYPADNCATFPRTS